MRERERKKNIFVLNKNERDLKNEREREWVRGGGIVDKNESLKKRERRT